MRQEDCKSKAKLQAEVHNPPRQLNENLAQNKKEKGWGCLLVVEFAQYTWVPSKGTHNNGGMHNNGGWGEIRD